MKTMMTKLAVSVNRMRMAIGHMFDAYEQDLVPPRISTAV